MSAMENVDFGQAADDYARHRAGFPDQFFAAMFEAGLVTSGASLLDIGTGTLARGFAARGCQVTGLDPSRELLAQAKSLAGEAALDIDWTEGTAEQTGLGAGAFDIVTAGQCWHWFDAAAAAAEARRLLNPVGRVIIAHFDWLPRPGNMVAATEALIAEHNLAWTMGGGDGRYPNWQAHLEGAGFAGFIEKEFEIDVAYSHQDWLGRIRASAGVGGTLAPADVEAFDHAHAAMLKARFNHEPLAIPHRVWWLTAASPG